MAARDTLREDPAAKLKTKKNSFSDHRKLQVLQIPLELHIDNSIADNKKHTKFTWDKNVYNPFSFFT